MAWLKKDTNIKVSSNKQDNDKDKETLEDVFNQIMKQSSEGRKFKDNDKDRETLENIFNQTIERLIAEETGLMNRLNSVNNSLDYEKIKQLLFNKATEKFQTFCESKDDVKQLCDRFNSYF